MSSASKEAIWLKRLLSNIPLNSDLSSTIPMSFDSQSAMKLASNESINRKNKHIDITYYFVHEVITNKEIVLNYVPTGERVADMLTMPLRRVLFQKLRKMCGVYIKGERCSM